MHYIILHNMRKLYPQNFTTVLCFNEFYSATDFMFSLILCFYDQISHKQTIPGAAQGHFIDHKV